MKKLTAFLLLCCLTAQLAACNIQLPVPTEAPDTGPTYIEHDCTEPPQTESIETQPPVQGMPQQPMVSVAVPVTHSPLYADDGTLLFDYAYQSMYLIVPDPVVADAVITDFLNKVDSSRETAQTLSAAAEEAYDGSSNWMPYLCSVLYDPVRIDQSVLSLYGSFSTFSGASHPEHVPVTASYDLLTGKVLTLADILQESVSAETLSDLILQALAPMETEKYLYSGYAETVTEQLTRHFADIENWYLSSKGLCFVYPQYEIAPYSSGIITAVIPYENLTGILKDAYFPAEQDTAGGTLSVTAFEQADLAQFTQLSELILQEGYQKVLLHADTSVTDVRITTGSWSKDGTVYTPEATVFAAAGLTPGDAVMIEADISDVAPSICISWQSGTETFTKYLFQSGKDGSILLTDN